MLIDSLHTSKTLGTSKIPIKDAKAALAEPLFYLINQFITGKFPEELKKACVTPLKKGNPEDPQQLMLS